MSMRTHYCGTLRAEHIGSTVSLCGWVARRREHGEHLAFVDLRDHTGLVQCVVDNAVDVRSEYVVRITGVVRARPEGTVNANLPDRRGRARRVRGRDPQHRRVAAVPRRRPRRRRGRDHPAPVPLPRHPPGAHAEEPPGARPGQLGDPRPRWRPRASSRSRRRCSSPPPRRAPESSSSRPARRRVRSTPCPQSPQLFKQLLMVAGVDRYYQIARCLRDEDLRADRQYEFVQLDAEMSFASPGRRARGDQQRGRRRRRGDHRRAPAADRADHLARRDGPLRHRQARPPLRDGARRADPDLRGHRVQGVRRRRGDQGDPGARAGRGVRPQQARPAHRSGQAGRGQGPGVAEGRRRRILDSPVAKFLSADEQSGRVDAALECRTGRPGADRRRFVGDHLRSPRRCSATSSAALRCTRARTATCGSPSSRCSSGSTRSRGGPSRATTRSAAPTPTISHLLDTEPLKVRALAYDLVLNGWELGSGSIRIHDAALQRRVFNELGISDEDADRRFGFFLTPFRYGAPPHGGFGMGIDRLVAILAGEENIREVIAFPKTQSGSDPMTNAPHPGRGRPTRRPRHPDPPAQGLTHVTVRGVGERVTFRAGVVGVIRRADGFVLAFERADVPGAWQLPQGGLDPGETPFEAAWREVERGDRARAATSSNRSPNTPSGSSTSCPSPTASKKTGFGQVQRWFLFRRPSRRHRAGT